MDIAQPLLQPVQEAQGCSGNKFEQALVLALYRYDSNAGHGILLKGVRDGTEPSGLY